ncbi:hypothetical protein ACFFU9_14860 [Mariniflexile ostreae]|uniref:DoxX-like protein n=1 Tax=Mariniflexile ostreae TaxID=1520892 RepID=A0ABV5FFA3_9FLAO
MISITFLILFMAFYVAYCSSKKTVTYSHFGFETWTDKHPEKGKKLALSLFLITIVLSYITFGFGAGLLVFFIYLMTLGSLIVILNPLKLLKPTPLGILFVLVVYIEVFIF